MVNRKRLEEFGKFIGNELSVTEIEANQLLRFEGKSSPANNIECNFFLIKCTATNVRENDFLQFIRKKVIQYTLKKSEYSNLKPNELVDVAFKAINRFVSQKNSGELGELILYFLLEGHQGAIQVLNKMSLKTDPDVHHFGSDGVHLEIKNNKVILYYGEAKTIPAYSTAITKATDSIKKFLTKPKKEKYEIDIIASHIDESKFGEFKEDLCNLLNPYHPDKENLERVHAIFIGYDWEKLKIQRWDGSESLTKYLSKEYKELF